MKGCIAVHEEPMGEDDDRVCSKCGSDMCVCEPETCGLCNGEGEVVDCCDDICVGTGECMHEGNIVCPDCGGDGWLKPDLIPREEYEKRKNVKREGP